MSTRDEIADAVLAAISYRDADSYGVADALAPLVDRLCAERAAHELRDLADLAAKDRVPVPCWRGEDVAEFLLDRALALTATEEAAP